MELMPFSDQYKEMKSKTKGIYKEKGSKFIAYAFPVYSKEDVTVKLEEIKKTEYAARHHCYAYILNPDKSLQKVNDDGEPSSTAGKPILGQILSNDLTNTLVVVVRYFGGVKLGISGLIRSYKTAASNAISRSTIISKTIKDHFQLNFKYPQMNNVMRIVKEYNLEIVNNDFQIECKLIFAVPKTKSEVIVNTFQENHELKIEYLKTV